MTERVPTILHYVFQVSYNLLLEIEHSLINNKVYVHLRLLHFLGICMLLSGNVFFWALRNYFLTLVGVLSGRNAVPYLVCYTKCTLGV